MNPEIAILVPAFNEEPRIGEVLEVLCSYTSSHAAVVVVVIDDGSTDKTAAVSKQYPIELVSLTSNQGKGAALQAGINHVQEAHYWLFVDADLINLQHEHLNLLLNPLLINKETAMTVGVFKGGKTLTDLAHRYFGILNGQRGFAGSFIHNLPDLSWSRFGVEIFLSKYAAWQGYPVAYPHLKALSHHMKEAKYGFKKGFYSRLQMYRECFYSRLVWKNYCRQHSKTNYYSSGTLP